jgi:hypothetical protein
MHWIDEPDYYRERDLPVYREELEEFLPDRVLDCHCHVHLQEHIARELTADEVAKSFGTHEKPFSVEDLGEALELLFPGKRFEALVFGMPSAYMDLRGQNEYVIEAARLPWVDGLALLPPGATDEDLAGLMDRGLVGLKPYQDLVGKPAGEVTIPDMVPRAARRVAQARGLIVMLHVPRAGRIADSDNIREVVELCEECPEARIVLAHVGRSYGPWYIEQAIGSLRDLSNLHYDIAALDDADTISCVLENIPHARLLFGTDLPIAAYRGKHLCVNRQCIFLTRQRFSWSVSSGRPGELSLTFFAYETVRALRRACERIGLGPREVEDICYSNARKMIDGVKARAKRRGR